MDKSFVGGKSKIKKGLLVWEGKVRPTAISPEYTLCLNYYDKKRPHIWVVDPTLPLHQGETRLPHTYQSNELCLYYPPMWSWHDSYRIADYILPWACLWLFYYEEWLISGEWKGGGKHPDMDSDKEAEDTKPYKKKKIKKPKMGRPKCIRLSEL